MSAMQTVREHAGTSGFERRLGHREAMLQLRYENLTASDVEVCVDMYHRTSDPFTRTQLLTALVLRSGEASACPLPPQRSWGSMIRPSRRRIT